MIDLATELVKLLKDPMLILLFLVILGLFYLLIQKDKTIDNLRVCIDTNMAEVNETVVKVVTLLEVLVYGRDRNGRP
jgi:succinate dehydrogenase hydrophobic anchor subunit